MMRKLPQYISQLFSCMLLFLLDVTVRFHMLVLLFHSFKLHGAGLQSVLSKWSARRETLDTLWRDLHQMWIDLLCVLRSVSLDLVYIC